MKEIYSFLLALVLVIGLSAQAHAALWERGTDSLGNRLIYDDDLNITWYDYTNASDNWQNQVDWASNLSVDFNGLIYDDWRLPSTVDDRYSPGHSGSTTAGSNITSSEMGHLFYAELGNKSYFDTVGNLQPGWGLINVGDFQNLMAASYWSGTEYSLNTSVAWVFNFNIGVQALDTKGVIASVGYPKALAVRPGDVAGAVPEPSTVLLLSAGIAGIGVMRKLFRK